MLRLSRSRTILAAATAVAALGAAGCSSPHSAAAPASSAAMPTLEGQAAATLAPMPKGSCTTSKVDGGCGPYVYPKVQRSSMDPTIQQNVWNPISGWHQTLTAANPGNWRITANMPKGNTAVVSYPNTGAQYDEDPVSKYKVLTSSFTENMHATKGTSAWAAFDLWFNNWDNEVMIQHDFAGNAPCPFVAKQVFGGSHGVPRQTWGLCNFGDELVWKLTGGSEQKGSVDILAMVTYLETHHYMKAKSTITDLSYGWEICSTGGKKETFQVSAFSITAS